MSKIHRILRIPLIKNKNNGQINFSLPKKKIDPELRKKIKSSRFAKIWFEDFD